MHDFYRVLLGLRQSGKSKSFLFIRTGAHRDVTISIGLFNDNPFEFYLTRDGKISYVDPTQNKLDNLKLALKGALVDQPNNSIYHRVNTARGLIQDSGLNWDAESDIESFVCEINNLINTFIDKMVDEKIIK